MAAAVLQQLINVYRLWWERSATVADPRWWVRWLRFHSSDIILEMIHTQVNESKRNAGAEWRKSCAVLSYHKHTRWHNVVTDKMIKWQQKADYKEWFTVSRCCVIINKRIFVRAMNQTACPNVAVCRAAHSLIKVLLLFQANLCFNSEERTSG